MVGSSKSFVCRVDEDLFEALLDVALRHWARRASAVLSVVSRVDQQRLDALTGKFLQRSFTEQMRWCARLAYFARIGQSTPKIKEDMAL